MHRDVSVIQVDAKNSMHSSQGGDFLAQSAHNIAPSQTYSNLSDDNGLSISPSSNLIIPQHLTEEEDVRTFKCCECDRFLTHCFFLFACCWFMLASSFARIMALGDIVLHVVVYIIEIAAGDDFFQALHDDWQNFQYKTSCLDLLVLSMFRTLACYWLYAYKRQLDRQVVWASLVVMLSALTYCVVKIFLVKSAGVRAVAIFSSLYTLAEWVVYTILRRRRVLVEQNNRQLDHDVDIESGGFIYYNTHPQNAYQSPHDTLFTQPNNQQQPPQSAANKNEAENLFTGIDGLADNNNNDNNTTTPNQLSLDVTTGQQSGNSRRNNTGPRRHKSTAQMKIGGIGNRSAPMTSDSGLLSPPPPLQSEIVSTPTSNNIYSPLSHHAITYAPQLPHQIQRLAHPNSQFLTFEGVRIHYKLLVNPQYQPYFDHLYSSNLHQPGGSANLQQSQVQTPLPDHLQPHQIPPCLVLIHGFMSTLFDFDHLASLLQQYSAILLFDRPGFGLSSMLTEQDIEYREHQDRTQQQRQQSVQAEISKLNKFLSEQQQQQAQNNASTPQVTIDPFAGLVVDEDRGQGNNGSTPATTGSNGGPGPGNQLMANVYDFYSLIKAHCPDHHPYRSQFIIRLITTFSHIYSLGHLGIILGGHHSGGTLALATLVEYSKIYTQLHSNPLLTQFMAGGVSGAGAGGGKSNSNGNVPEVVKSPIKGLILFAASIYDDGFPPLVKNIFSTSLGKSMVKSLLNSECGTVALKRSFHNSDAIPAGLIKIHAALNKYIPNKDDALYTMALTECQSNIMEAYCNYIISNLEKIEAPILVVHGEEDKIVPMSSTNRIIRALSGSASIQCVRISNCGHLSFEEAADTVARSLDSFITAQTRYKIYKHNNP